MGRSSKNNRNQNKKVAATEAPAQKQKLVNYLVVFIAGFLAGIAFTVYKSDPGSSPTSDVSVLAAGTQEQESQRAILNMEAEVTANPESFEAWIRLGHLYFDTDQPEKAIKAYSRSLELHPGDANLLTDLGIMYRRVKKPQKAIEIFDQAIAIDGTHLQSRLNKGIVLLYDLNDSSGAIDSWQEVLRLKPDASFGNGQPLAAFIEELRKQPEQSDSQQE